MATRQGHLEAQPGLRGHSVNPDDNKLKRFLVYIVLPLKDGGGLLARTSFDRRSEAFVYIVKNIQMDCLIVDQFDKANTRGTVVYSEDERFEAGEAL